MRSLSIILMLLITTYLEAQEKTLVDISGLPKGTYVLTITDTGAEIKTAKILSPEKPIPPEPPIPTPVPILNPRVKAIYDTVIAIQDPQRDKTATGISQIYRQIRVKLDDGTLKPDIALQALRMSTDMFLGTMNATTAWKPFREEVSTQWAMVAANGGKSQDYSDLLKDVTKGVEKTTTQQIDPAIVAIILEILKLVLAQLLK